MIKRYNGDGDPDANGEFYLVRDVSRLEDEVDDARRELARMREQLAGSEASRAAMYDEHQKKKSKHFGFADPHEARGFLKGDIPEMMVSRNREKGRVMRLEFPLGPRHYKHPGGLLPKIGATVYLGKLKGEVVDYAGKGELELLLEDGTTETSINWRLIK